MCLKRLEYLSKLFLSLFLFAYLFLDILKENSYIFDLSITFHVSTLKNGILYLIYL